MSVAPFTETVILTTGRAGSSLLANIFSSHGVFAPHNGEWVKKEMVKHFGFDLLGPIPEKSVNWKFISERELLRWGYKEGPWLAKHGAWFYKAWDNPLWIKTRRPLDKILDSYTRSGFLKQYSFDQRKKIMTEQIGIMESLPGVWVDTPKMVSGDYTDLETAFDEMGIEFRPEIADKLIDRTQFHVD